MSNKQTQAFNDIMIKSAARYSGIHLYAHKYFTETMEFYTRINQYNLSDREKALIAYAIYVGMKVGRGDKD